MTATPTPPHGDNHRAIDASDDVKVLVSADPPVQPVRQRVSGGSLRSQVEAREAVVEEIDRRTVAIESR